MVKRLQRARIRSVGTARNYQERLVQIAARLDVPLAALTQERAVAYLRGRAARVGQKTLDMERQAIQAMMVDVTGRMPPGARLPVVKSARPHRPRPRAYSPAQVRAVAARQDARNALATEIAHASGIRAHELLTLGRPGEQPPDDRRERSHLTGTAAEGMKFAGRDGVVYTVVGKGGLVREVLLPRRLAGRLEDRRRNVPVLVVDRGVRYLQRYDVGGGQAFSASFSGASVEALGKSRGAHGLRYGYAHARMRELMHHAEHRLALAIVSEELGHLRPSITTRYLI
ncbi:MAG: site-specific integrase [Gammaproteobacteria bacterium]|nr:site-specific integrase [Gammaproteobacteria bacterium]MYF28699.1 site-specific integrase [Gammaproteobacteria bacterium]MYI74024.1 site-specific integrase [Acidobacteriota bacterium]